LIVDPLYPSESLVLQGAIVLQLQLTTSGLVEGIEAIQGLRKHTQACIDAVKKWRFMPARDEQGKPIASDAFAVCVYRPLSRPADR